MGDFTRIPIGFDSRGCMENMKRTMTAFLDRMVDQFIEIFQRQIDANGHGSSYMKIDAKRAIREINREVSNDFIEAEVGFDEDYARSLAIDYYVRVMTVLTGNQSQGKLTSKPGRSTWKKNVTNYGPSRAVTVYKLPEEFNQRGDRSGKIAKNAIKEMEKHFKATLVNLEETFDANFFAMFVTGG